MPTLYHSPQSRSSGIVTLIDELGADIDIKEVIVRRSDGSGGPDPANPHPEKKVPYLVDGAETVRERCAIVLYLTDKYPDALLGPVVGAPGRGAYLSWLGYYQGVMEPVLVHDFAQVESDVIHATFRDKATMLKQLVATLSKQPYLLGQDYSAADLLCSGPFGAVPEMMPDDASIRDWVTRCIERPAVLRTADRDAKSAILTSG